MFLKTSTKISKLHLKPLNRALSQSEKDMNLKAFTFFNQMATRKQILSQSSYSEETTPSKILLFRWEAI